MENITRTEAQKRALEDFNRACRRLAEASAALRNAQTAYETAHEMYMLAHGSAQALGVL